ncbi:hypothetical protein [Kordia sp.]|uniref:hypothetical protein n=1 Tax=Kordia sp. TaxID=1965332 RepID=UPI003D6BE19F
MYLKGYKIVSENKKEYTLPKWDFGGDKPYTNRIWNIILADIKAIAENAYPLRVYDLDTSDETYIMLTNRKELENWLTNDF